MARSARRRPFGCPLGRWGRGSGLGSPATTFVTARSYGRAGLLCYAERGGRSAAKEGARVNMGETGGPYAAITGWGHYVPERVLTNADLERMVDTSDEWILARTGMRERHVVAPGESSSTMAT